jgi:hypothetical protein
MRPRAEALLGDQVNDRTFLQQVVYLTDLVRGEQGPRLDDVVFQDCQIIGPAVLVPMDNIEMSGCRFESPDVAFEIATGRTYFGMIAMSNTRFRECRFENVGFAGDGNFVEKFRQGTDS